MMPSRIVAILIIAAAAAYNGLSSCAAHSWQRPVVIGVALGVALPLLTRHINWADVASRRQRIPWRAMLLRIVLLVLVYLFAEAAAAPFYPDAPATAADWWSQFLATLKTGVC
jgi:hypothetical protein